MKQRVVYLLVVFVTSLGLSCGEEIGPGTATKPSPETAKVAVSTARMTEEPVIYEAVGTVKAGISTTLESKLLGTIEDIRVREGDQVKRGVPLVIIDQRQVKAELQGAEAGLAEAREALVAALSSRDAAQASKRLALTTYERYLNLKKQDSVTMQEFDEVEARYREAEAALARSGAMVEAATARVNQTEAALANARVNSRDAVVTAPHDGIITGKFVDKGDLAKPGTRLLALETTHGFCVDVVVPESYVDNVQAGQKVRAKVPALKTEPFKGEVCTIVPSADPRSRSFIVKVTLPTEAPVRSGMFARVEIPMGTRRMLLIPRQAVIARGQLTGLYLVNAQNLIHFRLIRPGRTYGDSVEVLSGLNGGEHYVLEPTPNLKEGMRVEVTP